MALVYYNREDADRGPIQELMEASARTGREKKEIGKMIRTIADTLKDEGRAEGEKKGREEGEKKGREEGRKEALIEQIREKFGDVPEKVIQKIRRTKDARLVDIWLKRVLNAASLDEMRIMSRT